jgi:biopolymer transport protein ExbD
MKLTKNTPEPEIPTSSMADIAFLLIVYFMLTATFAATRGLDFALPKDDDNQQTEIEPEDAVLIEIKPGGQVLVDKKPMEVGSAILEYLAPKLRANPKKPVIIQPDPKSPYGSMVQVFDLLRQGKLIDRELIWREKFPDFSEEQWEEGKNISISIPTQREIDQFWN